MKTRFLGIIPARYASTRFPGKPLVDMRGKPMIQRVYEQVHSSVDRLVVATDDVRIEAAVRAFGGHVVMTSASHRSGTERCSEACRKTDGHFDVVMNIQGDEPFVGPAQIELLKGCFDQPDVHIATLVKPLDADGDFEATLFNPNSPKVVLNRRGEALYFSRSVVPYVRGKEYTTWLSSHTFYRHIGLYAYRTAVLDEIVRLPPSPLELAENLEQLRWLEHGYKIKTAVTRDDTIGIDTPEDMTRALAFLDALPPLKED
ncbi:MAG: 3-deoxy-manno-octulosonate cytidylyltransferase [Tannerella sp.]|jgi:3-deoxy-manno-octulosonate cytidylyltransferase (CMP-KDO synthetase)|nr:3-deoxy-manno-octulosonate cytidylyltransferase [Tannerella sp.]